LRDRSRQLIAKLLQVRQGNAVITEDDAAAINQTLQELIEEGVAAVPAIRDFLRRMDDVDFDEVGGGDLVAHGSLRLGLLDALAQIGGTEALDVSLEQLRETLDPVEIAVLARNLEGEAPGVYGEEILNASRRALLAAGQAPPDQRVDVSPLFELFEAYGGADVVADLEHVMPTWSQYSLMALAGLPDGEGVPSLAAMAADPRVPVESRSGLPFQMLAQASAEYPEAGEALIDLARSGQVPDRAWGLIGAALQGMHLRFPLEVFDGMSPEGGGDPTAGGEAPHLGAYETKALDVRYDLRLTSGNWSDQQLDRQLTLIDALLGATANPTAVKALREARLALLGGGH
jgi:hypothetical protein